MALKWHDKAYRTNAVIATAYSRGRKLTIWADECRGITWGGIDEMDGELKRRLANGLDVRHAHLQFDASTSSNLDVELIQYCLERICKDQDRIDREVLNAKKR